MCLVVLGWQALPEFPFVVAANRDEFHGRPSARAGFWSDAPDLLAGRDLKAMGTWMGVARSGRFAAVTNYRGATEASAPSSRGALVTGFLKGSLGPAEYTASVRETASSYSGFNLLVADGKELWWLSNRDGNPRRLTPGIYGLGNLLLDSPEVEAAKLGFSAALQATPAPEPLFAELAKAKIVHPLYGTRCSTVLLRRPDGTTRYAERSFSPEGSEDGTVQYEFRTATALAA
jgi:uncharacterized protein with NRDE domain